MNSVLDVQNKPIESIGLFLKQRTDKVREQIKNVLNILTKENIDVKVADSPTDAELGKIEKVAVKEIGKQVDCVISLGGDGTMLQAARNLGEAGCAPIIGLHMGNLGFLTQIQYDEFVSALTALKEGRYRTKKRIFLRANVIRDGKTIYSGKCLNEVVVHREKIARVIDLSVQVNGMPLGTIRGDGVIIATPMGSTAYSLSAGGPIVHPAVKDIVITSLAPHTLTHRPVILPYDYEITVTPVENHADICMNVTLDGQEEHKILGSDKIEIKKSDEVLQLIDLDRPGRFFQTLQEKLHWRI